MSSDSFNLANTMPPEEEELRRRQEELERLEAELAEKELELATLESELSAFEDRYLRKVGPLYAKLDEIELKIAQALAQEDPESVATKRRVEDARRKAEESARAAEDVQARAPAEDFTPSEELKSVYRQVAKQMHPDLARSEDERERRTEIMAAANEAYSAGDIDSLKRILRDWEAAPEAIAGDDVGSKLVRVIRRIDQVKRRITEIDERISELEASELRELKDRYDRSKEAGEDLIEVMVSELQDRIAEAKAELARVSS